MKKLLLVAVTCLFSMTLLAQLSSPISLGVHAGLVNTKMDTESGQFTDISNVKENAENGMMLGAFLRINLNKWYLQPELNYVSRKSEIVLDAQTFDVKTKTLDVPLLLGYKIVKMPMFKLRAFAGPVASFNIDESIANTITSQYGDPSLEGAVWNVKFGAGVDVWKLTLDVDYEAGLSDISADYLKKNNMVNVTLGFKLF